MWINEDIAVNALITGGHGDIIAAPADGFPGGVETIENIHGKKTFRTMVKMSSLTHQKKIWTLKGKKKIKLS